MQLHLLELCKAEKVHLALYFPRCNWFDEAAYNLHYHLFQVLWSGVVTNYSTSPFAEEMFEKTKQMLTEYEVVINRWPQYTIILENVSSILLSMETCRPCLMCFYGCANVPNNCKTTLLFADSAFR